MNNKKYPIFQASQLMRKLETEVRKQKDIANMAKISGDDVLRREAQSKITGLKAKYNHISKQAALRARPERMVVDSFTKEQAIEGRKDAEAAYQKWAKEIGANPPIESLAKYYDVKYNEPERYRLLEGYSRAIKKGDISPLVGFEQYEKVSADISGRIVGVKTYDGVPIDGFATHFVDRVIGQTSTPHKGMRCGVPIDDVIDTLCGNDSTFKTKVLADGDIRRTYCGTKSVVTISVRDKRLIQTNPRKEWQYAKNG